MNHHNELKCLLDKIKSLNGRTALEYCWKHYFGKIIPSYPSTAEEWTSFFCPKTGANLIRTGKEVVQCFDNMVRPPVKWDFDDKIMPSEDVTIIEKCYRDSVDLDSK